VVSVDYIHRGSLPRHAESPPLSESVTAVQPRVHRVRILGHPEGEKAPQVIPAAHHVASREAAAGTILGLPNDARGTVRVSDALHREHSRLRFTSTAGVATGELAADFLLVGSKLDQVGIECSMIAHGYEERVAVTEALSTLASSVQSSPMVKTLSRSGMATLVNGTNRTRLLQVVRKGFAS